MDEFLQQLILGAPNLIVAIAVLLWARENINRKDDYIRAMNERLLALLEECYRAEANEPVKDAESTA